MGKKIVPEGAVFCSRFNRVFPPNEAGWHWNCRYFAELMPGEGYETAQYLLMKESEIADRK